MTYKLKQQKNESFEKFDNRVFDIALLNLNTPRFRKEKYLIGKGLNKCGQCGSKQIEVKW